MSSIKTTDCYVPVDVKTGYVVKALWQSNCPYWTDTGCAKDYSCNCERDERFDTEKENTVEKKEGVIVLTTAEYDKEIGDAKAEAVQSFLYANPSLIIAKENAG